jgi:hypothetical protein
MKKSPVIAETSDGTQILREVHALLQNLSDAENIAARQKAKNGLTAFLKPGDPSHIYAFCLESWDLGMSTFRSALEHNIEDIFGFPGDLREAIYVVITIWCEEFQKHPKQASNGLFVAEKQMWQRGDRACDWWGLWLRKELEIRLDKDVQKIMDKELR